MSEIRRARAAVVLAVLCAITCSYDIGVASQALACSQPRPLIQRSDGSRTLARLASLSHARLSTHATAGNTTVFAAQFALLHRSAVPDGWIASRLHYGNRQQFIQVTLPQPHAITAIATQGCGSQDCWLTSYELAYLPFSPARHAELDFWGPRGQFAFLRSGNGSDWFVGNRDSGSVAMDTLPGRGMVATRAVRIYPRTLSASLVCLRLELYGCPVSHGNDPKHSQPDTSQTFPASPDPAPTQGEHSDAEAFRIPNYHRRASTPGASGTEERHLHTPGHSATDNGRVGVATQAADTARHPPVTDGDTTVQETSEVRNGSTGPSARQPGHRWTANSGADGNATNGVVRDPVSHPTSEDVHSADTAARVISMATIVALCGAAGLCIALAAWTVRARMRRKHPSAALETRGQAADKDGFGSGDDTLRCSGRTENVYSDPAFSNPAINCREPELQALHALEAESHTYSTVRPRAVKENAHVGMAPVRRVIASVQPSAENEDDGNPTMAAVTRGRQPAVERGGDPVYLRVARCNHATTSGGDFDKHGTLEEQRGIAVGADEDSDADLGSEELGIRNPRHSAWSQY